MRRNRIEARIFPLDLDRIVFTKEEKQSIRALAASTKLADRRRAFDYLRSGQWVDRNKRFILEMCDRLIPDRSPYVRGQSLLLIGDSYAETEPEVIWPLVVKWGSVPNRDIRVRVACYVLEHILEYHFQDYFPRVKELIESGNRRFALTLSICWRLGEAAEPENKKMFDELVEKSVRRKPEKLKES